ncbi:MAG: hypothetical protein ACFFDK_18205 [Promethearchaeota archaeon]
MIIRLKEIFLIALYFSFIIGYQLSAYFLYQYKKYKKEKLVYNKILLSYGITIFLTLTGYLIQVIIELFLTELLIYQTLRKISFIVFSLAICYFLFTLLSKPFAKIINRSLIQILIIYIVITMICMLFITDSRLELSIRALAAILSGFFLLFFQIRLIRLTTGNIRKSLILFTIGLILALIGGTLSSREVYTQLGAMVYVISIFMILSGISTAFIGIYNFPAFLEFGWKDNLQKLYIFEQEKFRILYTYDFKVPSNTNSQNLHKNLNEETVDIFSRVISGVEQVTTHLTKSNSEKIHKIEQGSSYILLEYGDPPISHITYALLTTKDLSSLRFILREVKNHFQEKYRYLLSNLVIIERNEAKFFRNFNINLQSILK